jgi:hypothetical protein
LCKIGKVGEKYNDGWNDKVEWSKNEECKVDEEWKK